MEEILVPISEEALIEYVKPILKAEGYRKNKKRWMKVRDEFTYIFYIQGSCFDKNDYCIRPGILINALPPSLSYGHFWTEIKQTTPEQIVEDYKTFCTRWTDKALVKKLTEEFIIWDKRNPLEKRRAGAVDYINDPPPSSMFFGVDTNIMNYVIEYF